MKSQHYCIDRGLIVLCSIALTTGKALAALPLQVGVYHGGGSRYIQIAQKAKRICFASDSIFTPNYTNLHPTKAGFRIKGISYPDLVLYHVRSITIIKTVCSVDFSLQKERTKVHTTNLTYRSRRPTT
jgi:hypothetical protein